MSVWRYDRIRIFVEVFITLGIIGPSVKGAPTITGSFENRLVRVGSMVELRVQASATQPVSYQWYFNRTNLLIKETNASLVLNTAGLGHSGRYHAIVSDPNGSSTSPGIHLKVVQPGFLSGWGADVDTPLNASVKLAAASYDLSLVVTDDDSIVVLGADSYGVSEPPMELTDLLSLEAGQNRRTIKSIAFGEEHVLALLDDGRVFGWGENTELQAEIPSELPPVIAIAAGSYHSLALDTDGKIWGWGLNDEGQVSIPGPEIGRAVAIDTGSYHSLALLSDGTVAAWGYDVDGQANVPAGLSNVVAIAAGGSHNLALTHSNTVVSWGAETWVPASVTNVIAISAGSGFSIALRADGTVVAWGSENSFGEQNIPFGLSNVVSISAGISHSIAIQSDGKVVSWGDNANGQVSAGDIMDAIQLPLELPAVTAAALGDFHGMALGRNGELYGFGDNGEGQLNLPAGLTDVRNIGVGEDFSVALLADGTVKAWGDNFFRQVSDATKLKEVKAVAVQGYHGLALLSNRTVVAWGEDAATRHKPPSNLSGVTSIATGPHHSLAVLTSGRVVAWGIGSSGETSVPSGLTNAIAVAAGSEHSIALRADGTVVRWGKAEPQGGTLPQDLDQVVAVVAAGGLSAALKSDGTVVGWGTPSFRTLSRHQKITNAISICLSSDHCLAVLSDGTVRLWSADYPDHQRFPSITRGVVSVDVGQEHSMALLLDGSVRSWGSNFAGQTNVPSTARNVVSIATGDYHNLALTQEGRVISWGDNTAGQCDVPLDLPPAVAISAGASNSIALLDDGRLIRWGAPNPGDSVLNSLPAIVAISSGSNHTLAITHAGTVGAWGDNRKQQVTPPIFDKPVQAVAAGAQHSLALLTDGTVRAWGDGGRGQTRIPPTLPKLVAIDAGRSSSLALDVQGKLHGWGSLSSPSGGIRDVTAFAAGNTHALAVISELSHLATGFSGLPQIVNHPLRLTQIEGLPAVLGVSVIGADRFQWFSEERGLLIGQTNKALLLTPIRLSDRGIYHVVAYNKAGSAISKSVIVEVIPIGVELIRKQPFLLQAPASLTVALTNDLNLGRWRFDSETIWRPSGLAVTGLEPGFYGIEFSPIPGRVPPDPRTIRLYSGEHPLIEVGYTTTSVLPIGALSVSIFPASLRGPLQEPCIGEWQISGEERWRSSGEVASWLPVGQYLVQFRTRGTGCNYQAPAAQNIFVEAGKTNSAAAYFEELSAPGNSLPKPLSWNSVISSFEMGLPYELGGQIVTEFGSGSGVAVAERVVLTAAHVLYDDVTGKWANYIRWFPAKHEGFHQSPPLYAVDLHALDGYEVQRKKDGTPRIGSPESRALDAAVLLFDRPVARGGSAGYLVSNPFEINWLQGLFPKTVSGYPVQGIPSLDVGIPHVLGPGDFLFESAGPAGSVFSSDSISGFPGMSGGPVTVEHPLFKTHYPAGIFLGTGTRGWVRAIDAPVADLIEEGIRRARIFETNQSSGGTIRVGSLVVPTPCLDCPTVCLGFANITLEPVEIQALSSWRILDNRRYGRALSWQTNGQSPALVLNNGPFRLEFRVPTNYLQPDILEQINIRCDLRTNLVFRFFQNPEIAISPSGLSFQANAGDFYQLQQGSIVQNTVRWSCIGSPTRVVQTGTVTVNNLWILPLSSSAFYRVLVGTEDMLQTGESCP